MAVDAARAKSLFLNASDLDNPAERAAYLDQECGADAELRGRVEALLRANDAAPLPPAAKAEATVDSVDDQRQTEDPGDRTACVGSSLAGKYKLVEEVGAGGMGSVFMAQQTEPVKRAVAVKVIKAGMDSKAVLARFEAERQALAMMDHPNIAKVLDAGTTEGGRPFFVMELVKGVPITQYCDEHKLTPRQRLELFVPVCQAIQHAHQKGIIHRDIKPSNVLIALYDDRPVPKVIDFGVAKAAGQELTEKTLMTGLGAVVGTPEYMSPEQANLNNLDIDTRSDVYALGVLLYELLTGTTPVDKKSLGKAALLEILRIVREVEAPRPSAKLSTIDALPSVAANRGTEPAQLSKLMKGELDWVVMKALEKDRTRRYETASGLARDIQRYLADEVVEARPPSAGYRLRKFVRRNRGPVLAGALVLIALLLGIAAATLGLWEAQRQEEIARTEAAAKETALREEERQRAIAQRKQAEAEQSAAAEKTALREEERQRAIAQQKQAEAEKSAAAEKVAKEGEERKRREAEKSAAAEKVAKEGEERKRREAETNLAYAKKGNDILGSVFAGLDPHAKYETIADLRNALRNNLTRAVKELDGAAIGDRQVVAGMQNTLGLSLLGLGDYEQAITVLTRSRDTHRATLGPDHADTLKSTNNLALCYHYAGEISRALSLWEETYKLLAKLGPDRTETLIAMGNLAAAYKVAGQLDKALPLLEQAFKLTSRKHGPDFAGTLIAEGNLAAGYRESGQLDKALSLFEQLLPRMKAQLGPAHPNTLSSTNNMAAAYREAGQHGKAVELFEQVLKSRTATLGPNHADTLRNMAHLASAYREARQLDKALPLWEETLRLQTAKLGPDHPDTLDSMEGLATTHWSAKRLDKSIPLFEEALRLREKKLGRQNSSTLVTVANLGVNYRDAGRLAEAIPLLEEAYRASRKYPTLRWVGTSLLNGYVKAGKAAEAGKLIDQWLASARQSLPKDSPQLAAALASFGPPLLQVRAFAKAEALLRESLAIRAKTQPDAWTTFATQSSLGAALLGQKKYADAEPLLLKGYEGMKQRKKTMPPQGNVRLRQAAEGLVHLYEETKRTDEAKKWTAIVVTLDGKVDPVIYDAAKAITLKEELSQSVPALIFQVRLKANVSYVIDMVSPDPKALDPYLILQDGQRNKLAEDDDSGGNLNVRIVFRAPADGVYRLRATSFDGGRGPFTLTIRSKE